MSTATAKRTDTKLSAARVWFVTFFGLALGWAGVVVAAVAVAAERAKNGDDTVESAPRVGSGSWWDRHQASVATRRLAAERNARAWLERDRANREQFWAARERWAADPDARPEDEPKKPGYTRRVVGAAARLWHRSQLANQKLVDMLDRVRDGARQGWNNAAPYADQGPRAAWHNRHGKPPVGSADDPVDAEIVDDTTDPRRCAHCGATDRPLVYGGRYCDVCMGPDPNKGRCVGCRKQRPGVALNGAGFCPDCAGPLPPDQDQADGPATAGPAQPTAPAGGSTETPTGTGDQNMAMPTDINKVKANNNPAAVDGEDNLDRITAGLGQMGSTLNLCNEATDQLAAHAAVLEAQAKATMERAGDKASTATRQACDEAQALAEQIRKLVGAVSEASAACAESVRAADEGSQPNRQQRDDAIATGADPSKLFAQAVDA